MSQFGRSISDRIKWLEAAILPQRESEAERNNEIVRRLLSDDQGFDLMRALDERVSALSQDHPPSDAEIAADPRAMELARHMAERLHELEEQEA